MKIIGDELTAVDNFGVMEFQGYKLVLLKVLYGEFGKVEKNREEIEILVGI